MSCGVSLPEASDVQLIVRTSLSVDAVRAIISDAGLLVQDCVASFSPSLQQSIVKYVAAHIITTTGQGGASARTTSRRLGDAATSYSGPAMGANLAGTTYGQTALSLDPTGCLSRLGMPRATAFLLSP